jgi:hypothetical protein
VGPNYLMMKLVKGEMLASRLKKGKLSIEQTLQYCLRLEWTVLRIRREGL